MKKKIMKYVLVSGAFLFAITVSTSFTALGRSYYPAEREREKISLKKNEDLSIKKMKLPKLQREPLDETLEPEKKKSRLTKKVLITEKEQKILDKPRKKNIKDEEAEKKEKLVKKTPRKERDPEIKERDIARKERVPEIKERDPEIKEREITRKERGSQYLSTEEDDEKNEEIFSDVFPKKEKKTDTTPIKSIPLKEITRATNYINKYFNPLFSDPHHDVVADSPNAVSPRLKNIDEILAKAIGKVIYINEDQVSLSSFIAAIVYFVTGLRITGDIYARISNVIMFLEDRYSSFNVDDRKLIASACKKIINDKDIEENLLRCISSPEITNQLGEKIKECMLELCYLLLGRNSDNSHDLETFYGNINEELPRVAHQIEKLREINWISSIYCSVYTVLQKLKGDGKKNTTLTVASLNGSEEMRKALIAIKKINKFYGININECKERFSNVALKSLQESVIEEICGTYSNAIRKSHLLKDKIFEIIADRVPDLINFSGSDENDEDFEEEIEEDMEEFINIIVEINANINTLTKDIKKKK